MIETTLPREPIDAAAALDGRQLWTIGVRDTETSQGRTYMVPRTAFVPCDSNPLHAEIDPAFVEWARGDFVLRLEAERLQQHEVMNRTATQIGREMRNRMDSAMYDALVYGSGVQRRFFAEPIRITQEEAINAFQAEIRRQSGAQICTREHLEEARRHLERNHPESFITTADLHRLMELTVPHDRMAALFSAADEQAKAANEKARVLLMRHLTKEQQETHRKHGYFDVQGQSTPYTGRHFRIYTASATMNVYLMDGDRKIECYCAAPENVPRCDALLAQKVMIETNEREFMRKANKMRVPEHEQMRERRANEFLMSRLEDPHRWPAYL